MEGSLSLFLTYIILRINKIPPILAAKRIIQGLTDGIIPASVAGIKVGMFRPRHVNLGMVVVLDTIGCFGIACVDLLGGEGILNITPGEIVIATVS